MKLTYKKFPNNPPEDYGKSLADFLVESGKFTLFTAPPPKLLQANTRWLVEPASKTSSGEKIAPYLRAACICKANIDRWSGKNVSGVFLRHNPSCNGFCENMPPDVAEDYLAQRLRFYGPETIREVVTSKLQQLRADLRAKQ